MTLEDMVRVLKENPTSALHIMLPDGSFVPSHFHITEVGRVQKDFIDCGGTTRTSTACVLQIWVADDTQHRLDTTKLAHIIQLAAPLFPSTNLPVETEYDFANGTMSQLPVTHAEVTPAGLLLHLGTKHTACLAPDRCGIPLANTACGETSCC
jgi:hypothetical protein